MMTQARVERAREAKVWEAMTRVAAEALRKAAEAAREAREAKAAEAAEAVKAK